MTQGTAVVEFNEERSAREAIREYNGAELDGKTLAIHYASQGAEASRRIERRSEWRHEENGRRGGYPRRRGGYGRDGRGGGYEKRRFNERVRRGRGCGCRCARSCGM